MCCGVSWRAISRKQVYSKDRSVLALSRDTLKVHLRCISTGYSVPQTSCTSQPSKSQACWYSLKCCHYELETKRGEMRLREGFVLNERNGRLSSEMPWTLTKLSSSSVLQKDVSRSHRCSRPFKTKATRAITYLSLHLKWVCVWQRTYRRTKMWASRCLSSSSLVTALTPPSPSPNRHPVLLRFRLPGSSPPPQPFDWLWSHSRVCWASLPTHPQCMQITARLANGSSTKCSVNVRVGNTVSQTAHQTRTAQVSHILVRCPFAFHESHAYVGHGFFVGRKQECLV